MSKQGCAASIKLTTTELQGSRMIFAVLGKLGW